MERKWYFKNGSCFETYNILYDNGRFMLAENRKTKLVSFGPCDCFNSLFGFPVDWSCLTRKEAVDVLNRLILLDEKYPEVREHEKAVFGYSQIEQWEKMIALLEETERMNSYKITFSDGDSLVTDMNATPEEARAYYLGKTFNLGAERDRLVRCVSVEPC